MALRIETIVLAGALAIAGPATNGAAQPEPEPSSELQIRRTSTPPPLEISKWSSSRSSPKASEGPLGPVASGASIRMPNDFRPEEAKSESGRFL